MARPGRRLMGAIGMTGGGKQPGGAEDPPSERLSRAFVAEEIAGLRLATQVRLTTLAVAATFLYFVPGPPSVYAIWPFLALLAMVGVANYLLARSRLRRAWFGYLFAALDFALLTFSMIAPILLLSAWPPQMYLRTGVFVYFFAFLGFIALSYSPRLMLWAGLTGAAAWSGGVIWALNLPGALTGMPADVTAEGALARFLDPRFVDTGAWLQSIVAFVIVAGILAAAVWRSHRLVLRQAAAARERANLARHFPPSIVDQLAQTDEPLGEVHAQPVAVLFADIVGFTHMSEHHAPADVIAFLRAFHARLERAVFDHGGTLDKFLGDGVMATFGTPRAGPRDAANALACARAMLADMEDWNAERARAGEPPVRLSIGIHYGEAVLGDIGSERRLEFAVLGDVVNVASRLEAATRELGCRIAVSDDLIRAVGAQAGEDAVALLAGLRKGEVMALRGREDRLVVWTYTGREVRAG